MIYKPIGLLPSNEFYALGKRITISWRNSGDVMRAFRIKIWNNDSTSTDTVFDSGEVSSQSPAYSLDSTKLGTGTFKYTVSVYDDANQQSTTRTEAVSSINLFTISPVPKLTLNLEPDSSWALQSLAVSANYESEDGVAVKNYKFVLFDSNKNVIEESSWISDSKFEYIFTTLLENGESYYVQCLSVATNNIEASTDMVRITANYIKPAVHFALEALTDPCKPYVTLKWSVVRVIGELIGNGYYVDVDNNAVPEDRLVPDAEKMNLQADGSMVIFREGFNIDSDFTFCLWVEGIEENKEFLRMENTDGQYISLRYYQNRIHLFKPNGVFTTHLASDEIEYTGIEKIFIRIQQQGNLLDVFAKII